MSDFKTFLENTGLLHDVVVQTLTWNPEARTLELKLKDIYGNFKGLPEYRGPKAGSIVLSGVEAVRINVDPVTKQLNIYEFTAENTGADKWAASVSFWPGGRILASYTSATFPDPDIK